MLCNLSDVQKSSHRIAIANAYRMDEPKALTSLIAGNPFTDDDLTPIYEQAKQLTLGMRAHKKKQSKVDALLHHYDLSTEEGITLMCLAEALLRIPDTATMDHFISDKLTTGDWQQHVAKENSLFVNAATWSLFLTGKVYAPFLSQENNLSTTLNRCVSRLGAAVIRPLILQMMKAVGNQFVLGQKIESALKRGKIPASKGYLFSYDMLGEAARTEQDAIHYLAAYTHAIHAIGQTVTTTHPNTNPGISIKLSALHPRYDYTQRDRVIKELTPLLLELAVLAKQYQIGLTVDAEEADRLDLSLDIFECVFTDPKIAGWEGFGLAVQAYQKRAPYVIDWLADLSRRTNKRLMIRLIKGAYWDSEIKQSQINGYNNYPVFTRKAATDVSYLTCAKKLLSQPECFYPQFGTHNAYSVAAILNLAGQNAQFEFQCLHGMGRPLYDQIIGKPGVACRIYAPVGTHRDLLGYLVRRLLENGANSSFINQLAQEHVPLEKMLKDPYRYIKSVNCTSHPNIPLPKCLYPNRQNSQGLDLSNPLVRDDLAHTLNAEEQRIFTASSLVPGVAPFIGIERPIYAPAQMERLVGNSFDASNETVLTALSNAHFAETNWSKTTVEQRSDILLKIADVFQENLSPFLFLMIREAGKCPLDALGEIREAIDYCYYYAAQARHDFKPLDLISPTGESNQLTLHPRGTILCISPWNFPLAIFSGQVLAALVTGNTVIAKPSEQTPLIAHHAVQCMHHAGIPKEVLQLILGPGKTIGQQLVSDARVAGVMFTGSTQTAKSIERSLSQREGVIAKLIAETGGQNALIADSSILLEQTAMDVVQSAFNSAGQRCSALRVLFVQEDIAAPLLRMISGIMQELRVGNPDSLVTDIGPVIDERAKKMLENHMTEMEQIAKFIAAAPTPVNVSGHFFTPCIYEIDDLSRLKGEVFGPVLHVIRYAAKDLNKVIADINRTGYGLTVGIHSRIEATITKLVSQLRVGNIYVNRNIIGAVVGVQPFGGERLSGTGPKAGGPHYLPALCVERCLSINTVAVGANARLVSLTEEDDA